MRCNQELIFKNCEKRDGGKFTNEKGEDITYKESFVLQADEVTQNGIYERKFKFPIENTTLANALNRIEPYTKINIIFDVSLYGSQARVVPVGILEDE